MRIGDLAKATDTKVETIRWYEKEGLLPEPARTSGNYRSYGTKHLDRLSFIRRARNLGFSLDDVRELMALAGDSEHPCEAVDVIAGSHLVEVKRKIADLELMRDELARMVGSCRKGTVADCRIIETLASRQPERSIA
ncbi:MerR family transcriptional regulator [Novosphingobium cyanobacteriorum]|uniref:Helix-turn-helix domain-containing protein n=1 Tax=Novosphingobium cyanobacteriorum TaxID=3024215 RepID=A0ABT6CS27_9SPHN|nr:helix-turn-helix domain-containing protein [Novosphingobium cyanobacteriorum]MDF8335462.1 helix-turn-helix domain-containing protein [Novosphingobium cyanobacteriorum]